jgi:hypothetical protein
MKRKVLGVDPELLFSTNGKYFLASTVHGVKIHGVKIHGVKIHGVKIHGVKIHVVKPLVVMYEANNGEKNLPVICRIHHRA